jgi:hypothetical protein
MNTEKFYGGLMQKIESMSREELIKKLKLSMEVITAVDGMWFMNVEELAGYDKALDVDIKVWEHYPRVLERRMKKYYEFEKKGLEGLKEMIEHDPMLIPMDFEFIINDEHSMIFRVHKCPGLEAMERMDRKVFTCEPVETVYLKSFAKICDPRIELEALKLPPRASENDICCEWLFTLD